MFFVGKKDGRLRMVCDCRLSNCHFAAPQKVRLCTAEAMTRIEVPGKEELFISSADLKDAFYHFQLPVALRPYFGMRPVRAAEVGVTSYEGEPLQPDSLLFPRLKVLPMGWSHALFWCQKLHQHVVSSVGASADTCLEDKCKVPDHSCMHIEYVDNFVVLGTCKAAVDSLAEKGVAALRSKGLVVREVESSSTSQGPQKVLGWEFNGSKIRPLPHRVWRIKLALLEILKQGIASGRRLEKVIGHAAFVCLGRREGCRYLGTHTPTYNVFITHQDVFGVL